MAWRYSIDTGNWTSTGTWGSQYNSLDSDASNWTGSNGATVSNNTTTYVEGTGSLQIAGGTTDYPYATRTFTAEDWSDYSRFGVLVRADVAMDATEPRIWIMTDDSNYKWWYVGALTANTWKKVEIDLTSSGDGSSGTLDLSSITKIRFDLNTTKDNVTSLWDNIIRGPASVPTTGDQVWVVGDTVTYNKNSTTDKIGTAGAGNIGIRIGNGGVTSKLTFSTSMTTNLEMQGDIQIDSGGTLEVGSTTTPIPSDYIARIRFLCSGQGSFGIRNNSGGSVVMQGASKTQYYTTLTSAANASDTVLYVVSSDGFVAGDEVLLLPTASETSHEVKTIQSVGSGTITLTDGLSYAHANGCHVLNLTRNVRVQGIYTDQSTESTSYTMFLYGNYGEWDLDWVDMKYSGASATGKYGILDLNRIAGAYRTFAKYCVFRYGPQSGLRIDQYNEGQWCESHHCIIYGVAGTGLYDRSYAIGEGCTFTYMWICAASTGIDNQNWTYLADSWICSCPSSAFSGGRQLTAERIYAWFNGSSGGGAIYGNPSLWRFICSVFGKYCGQTCSNYRDVYFQYQGGGEVHIPFTSLNSSTKFYAQGNQRVQSRLLGNDLTWEVDWWDRPSGNVKPDTSVYRGASGQSIKFEPGYASQYNPYIWCWKEIPIPVESGQLVTVTIYCRKVVSIPDENKRPRIHLYGCGITDDIDIMSNATNTWEQLSVSGTPTRTGVAMLRLMSKRYSDWTDFTYWDDLEVTYG